MEATASQHPNSVSTLSDLPLGIFMHARSTPSIHPYGFDPELRGWLNIMILAGGHMSPGSISYDSSRLFKMARSRLVGSNVLGSDSYLERTSKMLDCTR